jgi:hypothetical protein
MAEKKDEQAQAQEAEEEDKIPEKEIIAYLSTLKFANILFNLMP